MQANERNDAVTENEKEAPDDVGTGDKLPDAAAAATATPTTTALQGRTVPMVAHQDGGMFDALEEVEEVSDIVTKHNTVSLPCPARVLARTARTEHVCALPGPVCAQTILQVRGGRPAVNGDPKWELVKIVQLEKEDPVAATIDDLPNEVLVAVEALKGGGGGFSNAGDARRGVRV